jgi:hypothetical protein
MLRASLTLACLALAAGGCSKKSDSDAAPTPAPAPSAPGKVTLDASRFEKVEVPEVRIRTDGPTTVRVTWSTPPGTAVNDDAPFRVRWNRSDGLAEAPADVKSTGSAVKDGFRVSVQPMTGASHPTLAGEIDIVVCDAATHSVCVPVRRGVELGFIAAQGAAAEAKVTIPLPQVR